MTKYYPESLTFPISAEDRAMYEWIFRELNRISQTMNDYGVRMTLEKQYVAPTKPQDGDVVYADGTSWNPGGGVGMYARINGAWVKLS